MLNHHDMESSSENDTDLLDVADDVRRRRRKLSHTGKVSGSEFFKVVFKVDGHEWEDLVPATRGICLQEAISCACERRGVEVDCIDVFLDNNNTPLPLLTSETSWLGGRTLKIRGKFLLDCVHTDESDKNCLSNKYFSTTTTHCCRKE